MSRILLFILTISAFFAQPALAQQTNLAGVWRCIANSPVVSMDLVYQVNPDYSLFGQGTIIYAGTSRIYEVQGYGSVSASPPDASSQQWIYRFQMAPQNHAIFAVFARPTQDPNSLFNQFQDPSTGMVIETSCARIG